MRERRSNRNEACGPGGSQPKQRNVVEESSEPSIQFAINQCDFL